MRTTLFAALAAGALLACASTGTGQRAEPTAARPDAPVKTAHPYEVEGKVQATGGLLGLGRSVTIAREDAPKVVLRIAEGTRILMDDKPARLSDLREGDDVRALFDFDEGSPVAIDVHVKRR
jgi:hypothetical protein